MSDLIGTSNCWFSHAVGHIHCVVESTDGFIKSDSLYSAISLTVSVYF